MKAGWVMAASTALVLYADIDATSNQTKGVWLDRFEISKADLLPTGTNPYIPMQPGRVLTLKNGIDTLTVTVLSETQLVDGVTAGILEERETKRGKLVEVSRNFLATHKHTGDVYYFGEDVDNYKNGKIISHDSAWRAGVADARFGLMIPANPTVGQKFYQEVAPKVAMDRVEVVSINETVKTPAGTFEHVVHLRETTPLERDVSHKYYAPGIGMIKDDAFELAQKPGSTAGSKYFPSTRLPRTSIDEARSVSLRPRPQSGNESALGQSVVVVETNDTLLNCSRDKPFAGPICGIVFAIQAIFTSIQYWLREVPVSHVELYGSELWGVT